MKRIAGVYFFGIALAAVLAFGIPGNANAIDNGTNGQIILAGFGVGVDVGGVGAGVDIGDSDANRYDRERAYERERARERADRDRENRY